MLPTATGVRRLATGLIAKLARGRTLLINAMLKTLPRLLLVGSLLVVLLLKC
jgi:hypothetical protein